MVGGVDLHVGADLTVVADTHRHHVEDHAVEVHERITANADVVAVVAIERRANHRAFANLAKVLHKQPVACVVEQFDTVVVAVHPVLVGDLLGLQFRAASMVELAGEHFVFFAEGHGNSFLGLCSVRESADDRTTFFV
ncbi:hypothetical protein D3C79_810060 [compost metagenome]